jgi:uncharacterized caspase-like protein
MSGTRLDDLNATALSWTLLADAIGESRGTVVVVLDACHSGLAGREVLATNDAAVQVLLTRQGAPVVVFAGSKGRQESLEIGASGGTFTNAIVAAISSERAKHDRDRNGLIDLGELYAAIKARVMSDTQGRQTPWLVRNGLVGEMSLF